MNHMENNLTMVGQEPRNGPSPLDQLRVDNERLKAELVEAKKDADRYRWLRDNLYTQDGCLEISIDIKAHDAPNKSDIDYAIDSAKRGN